MLLFFIPAERIIRKYVVGGRWWSWHVIPLKTRAS